MNSPIYLQWQVWEKRIQDWLNNSNDNLELPNTQPMDRIILTVLTIKYQLVYHDVDKDSKSTKTRSGDKRESTVILYKTKLSNDNEQKERHRDKEKLFCDFTGRLLSPQQVRNDNSPQWQEFNQLYEWHGLRFLQRFEQCLRRFVSTLLSNTLAYQELIREPPLISLTSKVDNEVYQVQHDGHTYLSVDMQSANFALLQHIGAIDSHIFPTWSDFLSMFVGSRPVLVESKKLRMRCLGEMTEYHKLEALWTHHLAVIYQKVLRPYLEDIDENVRCVALSGDEVVFHLSTSIKEDQTRNLIEDIQKRIRKQSPIVKFHVRVYRLKTFQWNKKHLCFGRMFLGEGNGSFDLKCVPNKERNYEQALADFRKSLEGETHGS